MKVRARPVEAVLGLVVLAACGIAGCANAQDPTAPGLATSTASIQGVVVDSAVRPLAGAVVTIPAIAGLGMTTGEDGLFRFEALAPGLHLVAIDKPGFLPTVVQAEAGTTAGAAVLTVVLEPLPETRPYVVVETFDGFLDCGIGSAPLFGFTSGCRQTASAGLAALCHGQPPVPPTGICLDETDPYFRPGTRGNITVAQAELTWDPSLQGAELLLLAYVFDEAEQVVGTVGFVSGPPFLVLPMNRTVVDGFDLGGTNHVGLYVSAGSRTELTVVAQQPFRLFHTAAYFFELPEGWTFVRDGLPDVPPTCTTCLAAP